MKTRTWSPVAAMSCGIVLALVMSSFGKLAHAQAPEPRLVWREQAVLRDSPSIPESYLGWRALALDSDRIAAGTPSVNAVTIFRRVGTSWLIEARLTSDAAEDEAFGRSVELQGSTLVVGAPNASGPSGERAGAVYAYVRDGTEWRREARLDGSAATAGDRFGLSLALDGGTLVVASCSGRSGVPPDPGALDVFERDGTGWRSTQRLIASDAEGRACYPDRSLALEGGLLVHGAPWQDWMDLTFRALGAAFVFERGATGLFVETARLRRTPEELSTGFGSAVALRGDLIAVGAPSSALRGELVLFRAAGAAWTEETTLRDPELPLSANLGLGLSAETERVATGAPTHRRSDGSYVGQVQTFVLRGSSWEREAVIDAPDPEVRLFGQVVLTQGAILVVSSASEAVFVYALRHTDGDACTGADDCHSGFCVDGVCCDTACGDGALDCMACSVAAGGAIDGICGPVGIDEAIVCRSEAGECDAAERCDGASTSCPDDGYLDSTIVCRVAAGACDAEEHCTGSAPACPSDAAIECDDGDRCTIGSCAEPGGCSFERVLGCCASDGECDDGIACTSDSCDAVSARCVHSPAGCDAGARDGGITDALDAGSPDAGVVSVTWGCRCRAAPSARSRGPVLACTMLVLLALPRVRGSARRRARRSNGSGRGE